MSAAPSADPRSPPCSAPARSAAIGGCGVMGLNRADRLDIADALEDAERAVRDLIHILAVSEMTDADKMRIKDLLLCARVRLDRIHVAQDAAA